MNFGQRLKQIIHQKNVQQVKIAELCNLSKQQVCRIIKNDLQPRDALEMSQKIADVIDVNPHWLAFGLGASNQIKNYSELTVFYGDDLKPTNVKIPVTFEDASSDLFAFRIDTTSLAPEIPKNSIAIINQKTKPKDGDFILIKNMNNHLMIRKIYYTTNGIALEANIDKVTCSFDEINILGVVQEFRVIFEFA